MRDTSRCSVNELRADLAGAEKALIELGERTLGALPQQHASPKRVITFVACR